MTEVWGGRYKYDFTSYDKTKKYLISTTDGTTTQEISNEMDSYLNKDDWKGGSRWAIVYGSDEKTIEARFKTMLDEFKKDSKPHNDLAPELIKKLEELQNKVSSISIPEVEQVEIDYWKISKLIESEIKKNDKSKKFNNTLNKLQTQILSLKKIDDDLIASESELKLTKKQLMDSSLKLAKEQSKSKKLEEIQIQIDKLKSMIINTEQEDALQAIESLLQD